MTEDFLILFTIAFLIWLIIRLRPHIYHQQKTKSCLPPKSQYHQIVETEDPVQILLCQISDNVNVPTVDDDEQFKGFGGGDSGGAGASDTWDEPQNSDPNSDSSDSDPNSDSSDSSDSNLTD